MAEKLKELPNRSTRGGRRFEKLLGEEKDQLLLQAQSDSEVLDLDAPVPERARQSGGKNQYDSFFD